MQLKKRVIGALLGVAALTAAAVGVATPAHATVYYGSVVCSGGDVVGIWVEQSGNSGWASRTSTGYGSANWNYNFNSNDYKITVGCGGTPQAWGSSNYGPWVNNSWASRDYVCDVGRHICALS